MRRDINFFSVYHSQPNSEGADKFKLISSSVVAGSIIIILAIFSVIKISDFIIVNKLQEGANSLESPQILQAEQKLTKSNAKVNALNNYKSAADKVVSGINAAKGPDSSTLALIASKEPADVAVMGVSYASGCITLNCTAADIESPANFVHALQQNGSFSNISNSEITKGDNNQYKFDIAILLKGGKSK